MNSTNKRKIIISIIILLIVVIIGISTFIYFKGQSKYQYINSKGDKFTSNEISEITINNSRIEILKNQLKNEEEKNLGTITNEGAKDLQASIPNISGDSAKNILDLQYQLLQNLQQDVSAN